MQTTTTKRLQITKSAIFFVIICFCFLLCVAAFGADEIVRKYDYKGFDTNGNLLVQGVVTMHVDESNKVSGDWNLQVLDRDRLHALGPQDGTGKIRGYLKDDRLFINLNPEEFGDNIYADGKVSKVDILTIKGIWTRYGYYDGKMFVGVFEMATQPEPPKTNMPFALMSKPATGNTDDVQVRRAHR
jgi:hypothetical protein